jgi:hypothetical protein
MLEVFNEEKDLIRVKLKSNFTSNTIHNTWIKFSREQIDPVNKWYCDCPQGGRVLGFCSHVASVLYYLGVVQYDLSLMAPKQRSLLFNYCFDAKK